MINSTKVRFDDYYGEESFENVNHNNIADKCVAKNTGKLIKNNNFILIVVVYVTLEYYV